MNKIPDFLRQDGEHLIIFGDDCDTIAADWWHWQHYMATVAAYYGDDPHGWSHSQYDLLM